jgi:hypothetical protein
MESVPKSGLSLSSNRSLPLNSIFLLKYLSPRSAQRGTHRRARAYPILHHLQVTVPCPLNRIIPAVLFNGGNRRGSHIRPYPPLPDWSPPRRSFTCQCHHSGSSALLYSITLHLRSMHLRMPPTIPLPFTLPWLNYPQPSLVNLPSSKSATRLFG